MSNYYTNIQKHNVEINNKIRSSMMKMKSKKMDQKYFDIDPEMDARLTQQVEDGQMLNDNLFSNEEIFQVDDLF